MGKAFVTVLVHDDVVFLGPEAGETPVSSQPAG